MSIEVIRAGGEPIFVQLTGSQFASEEETGETIVPKAFLKGFRLSEIPDDVIFKPVELIEGTVIHVKYDIGLSRFSNGSAVVSVEEMFRRKFWDADVGLSPYVAALRQAIAESERSSEMDFEDDGDYILLRYEVTLVEDLDIQDAIGRAETAIEEIQEVVSG